jgi:aconitate hydratase
VNMGVLPLEFLSGQSAKSLGLTGEETFDILGLDDKLTPRSQVTVVAQRPDGSKQEFKATVRIDTPVELEYYKNGGILHTVVRMLAKR